MSVKITESVAAGVVSVDLQGKLHKEDYQRFAPQIEQMIQRHGKLRMLVDTTGFEGWDAGGLWQDIKFDARHFNDISRLAIVGDKKWHKGMATFCKPFTSAEIRYFEPHQRAEADAWLASSAPGA